MKFLAAGLVILFCFLQYKLWFSDGKVQDLWVLEEHIDVLSLENDKLQQRNRQLAAEVKNLKKGLDVIEEKARQELGLIGKDETFFQYLEQ